MRTMIESRRPGGGRDGRLANALWPPSFPDAPHARSAAYGLAGLVLELFVAVAFDSYWADSYRPRPPLRWLWVAGTAPSILLMCAALLGALITGRKSLLRRSLSALAWTVAAFTSFSLPLLLFASGADLCETIPPPVPVYLDPVLMVPVCLAASLAVGSLASAGAWAVTRRRMHDVGLYAVWIASAGVAVLLLLGPILAASPTCSPMRGG
ncbi:hypothetical protein [Streptomyces scabiei]|uniref:Uncharacterized protein n=1 Tax=Streptomyces scabiei TaxID=1930 RepID=A0A100JW54_STRSC|nr:hypothetical protein [Streptomyces scabiei]GAQ66793.1 hypothetical protein SsS58_07232 [Streptomyces scabiei]